MDFCLFPSKNLLESVNYGSSNTFLSIHPSIHPTCAYKGTSEIKSQNLGFIVIGEFKSHTHSAGKTLLLLEHLRH